MIHLGRCEALHSDLMTLRVQEEAFDRALCWAILDCFSFHTDLKQRGCCRVLYPGESRLEELASGEDPVLRSIALIKLWQGGSARNVRAVLRGFSDEAVRPFPWLWPVAESVRKESSCDVICAGIRQGEPRALAAAAALRLRAALEPILERLAAGSTRREDLVWALGEIGDPRAIPALVGELDRGGYWSRADAAEALGKIGDRSVLPELVSRVESADALTQTHVFLALARIGTGAEVPLLEHYAGSDEYTGAISRQSIAAHAIEEICRRAGR